MTHQTTDVEAHLPGPAAGPTSDRRTLLRVAGLTGVVGAVGVGLAACSSSAAPAAAGAQNTAGSAGAAGNAPTSAAAQTSADTALGTTSQIPVGGGMIFSAQKVVVTQPTAGTFKAFSSTCTHQGCQVNQVVNGLIECPCHGSHYSITDGSVQAGPAPKPLPAEPITVKAGEIFLTA
jgi:Rieske Fe-S protein